MGYKSAFYKQVEEEEKNGCEEDGSSIVWDQLEKKKRYSLMVKENFKPKASRLVQLSMEHSHKPKSERKPAPDLSRVRELGKFYLEYVKSLDKNRSTTAAP